MIPGLVKVSDHDIQGINFYWTRRDRFNLSEEELRQAGVTDGHAYVDGVLLPPLLAARERFRQDGYDLIVKDAYRSPELYRLVQQKRYEVRGKEETDKLLNMETMPHTSGRAIDINLIDLSTGEEARMRDPKDDPDAFFLGFYEGETLPERQAYHRLQELMVGIMLEHGFRLGSKREFWHFEY